MVVSAPKTRLRLRQAAIALSIANLSFLYIWQLLISVLNREDAHFFSLAAPRVQVAWALITDVCVLAAVIFAAFLLLGSPRRWLRAAGAAVITLFCLFAVFQILVTTRSILSEHDVSVPGVVARAIALVAALCLAVLLLTKRRQTLREIQTFFLFVSPAFVILAANSLWAYHAARAYYTKPSIAGMLPATTNRNRVVWMIFDELDGRMLLNPPNGVQLPEFDRLRAQSLEATRVTSPSYSTLESLPSLMTGKFVAGVKIKTTGMQLHECNGNSTTSINFNSEPNVFKLARAAGFNAAVSGWSYPYCRMLANSLSDCAWDISGISTLWVLRSLELQPFYSQAVYLAWWQSRVLPFLMSRLSEPPEELRMTREGAIETFQVVVENATRMLRDPKLNFVFLHFPIPHPPGIWDSKRKVLTTGNSHYTDNLLLADKVLGQMRSALQQTGDWDRTTVLVSADHPYHIEWSFWYAGIYNNPETFSVTHGKWQPYVPFLLKLPSQHNPLVYSRSFNSIVSGELVLQALEGTIKTPADAAQWLDAHASPHPGSKRGVCPKVQ